MPTKLFPATSSHGAGGEDDEVLRAVQQRRDGIDRQGGAVNAQARAGGRVEALDDRSGRRALPDLDGASPARDRLGEGDDDAGVGRDAGRPVGRREGRDRRRQRVDRLGTLPQPLVGVPGGVGDGPGHQAQVEMPSKLASGATTTEKLVPSPVTEVTVPWPTAKSSAASPDTASLKVSV